MKIHNYEICKYLQKFLNPFHTYLHKSNCGLESLTVEEINMQMYAKIN